ncbi:MAG TPA: alkaline phosphatase family protein [Jatrophihabitans sp.]
MVNPSRRRAKFAIASAAIAAIATTTALTVGAPDSNALIAPAAAAASAKTATPIQHVVVLFDENVSFDHYFGTYPKALNDSGPTFVATKGTPKANNLITPKSPITPDTTGLMPTRLSPSQAVTCDENHTTKGEEAATNNGQNNLAVTATLQPCTTAGLYNSSDLVLDYYDGNTVTGLWNYAQNYAMSDNSYSDVFGPSTPGALNLVSGETYGFREYNTKPVTVGATTYHVGDPTNPVNAAADTYAIVSPTAGLGTVINDPDPVYDDCANTNGTSSNTVAGAANGQKNIGDVLNAKNVSWGWFQGGFAPTTPYDPATGAPAQCGAKHTLVAQANVPSAQQQNPFDYSAHHNPFEYYASTANQHHLAPTNPVSQVGQADPTANHQYDLSYFNQALAAGDMPSVSFLKAASYQDGHAKNSDPIDEQNFLVTEINAIEKSKLWPSTAIVIAYDDSDGWYDHQLARITHGSNNAANDVSSLCTSAPLPGGEAGRCGPGTRQPLLVVSPYSKTNYIDHTLTTQSSITKFIETNWKTGSVGGNSFDATAGSLNGMFDFKKPGNKTVILRTNGTVSKVSATVKLKAKKPTFTGKFKVGKTVKVKPGTWTVVGTTYKYQWYSNGKKIKGATKATFKVAKKYAGKKITVRVIGTQGTQKVTSPAAGKKASA